MLGLAEFSASGAELGALAEKYEALITENLDKLDTNNKRTAAWVARQYVPNYMGEYEELLERSIREIAKNAAGHYADELGINIDEDAIAEAVVAKQYKTAYYGFTLAQRIAIVQRTLLRRIANSGNHSVDAVKGVFTSPLFGSQLAFDRRLLLGTVVAVENQVVRHIADKADVKLIRWRLSHRHKVPDICDDLATNIDREAIAYLAENNLNEDPKGLYLAKNLPLPPHPNCQCEFGLVLPSGTTGNRVRRTLTKVLSLLRRFRRK